MAGDVERRLGRAERVVVARRDERGDERPPPAHLADPRRRVAEDLAVALALLGIAPQPVVHALYPDRAVVHVDVAGGEHLGAVAEPAQGVGKAVEGGSGLGGDEPARRGRDRALQGEAAVDARRPEAQRPGPDGGVGTPGEAVQIGRGGGASVGAEMAGIDSAHRFELDDDDVPALLGARDGGPGRHPQIGEARAREAPAGIGASGQPLRLPGPRQRRDVAGRGLVLVAPGEIADRPRTAPARAATAGTWRGPANRATRPAASGRTASASAVRNARAPCRPPHPADRPPQIEAGGSEAEERREERPAAVAPQDVEEQAVAERGRIGIDVEEIGAEAEAEEAVELVVEGGDREVRRHQGDQHPMGQPPARRAERAAVEEQPEQ